MNRPTDELLLAFLEGELGKEERDRLLDQVERDPDLAGQLRAAAAGLAAVRPGPVPARPVPLPVAARRVSPWWVLAAAAAAVGVAVPVTWRLAPGAPTTVVAAADPAAGPRESGFVLVLHGRWPDAAAIDVEESRRRAEEYWAWTDSLTAASVLIAAGDLRWEPGMRLGPGGAPVPVGAGTVASDDFVVGMFALRGVTDYETAMAIARQCPHLRYGGSVSIRQVGTGFVANRAAGG